MYDWRKKPYHHEDRTITSKRWKRTRLVAREFAFAEGKRDDIFSPATSGHVLKRLLTIFLQGVSEEEEEEEKEAREGEGAFSQLPRCEGPFLASSIRVPHRGTQLQVQC